MKRQFLFIAAALLAACSPQQQAAAGNPVPAAEHHPESGLAVIPLTVTATDGAVHKFRVEIAATEAEQAKGLMFREAMGADEGMIFPRNPPDFASFWMHNTVIPLDIIFVGTDHRIINISANAKPYSENPRSSMGLAAAVLELNGGRAAQLGIGPGAKVDW
ncbi:MAG: DUF192 domain-containing protein [Candidatus Andeanibacterium colombiense]|uniref:DUF192 domain-containing protein n=1 Tax=Candidatus Andeanibacterium colombiense TaxID=3121345 RepID=A0AAJ5X5B5_9SPHN|nr:MAG: DUF192 domain-containing protein [Sphingomonadaceae bacterium]